MHEKNIFFRKQRFGWKTRFSVTIAFLIAFVILLLMIFFLAKEEVGILLIGLVLLLIIILIPLAGFTMDVVYKPR
jgi:uncharacterized Tic20 family protein